VFFEARVQALFPQIPSEYLTSPSSFWTAELLCLSCLMNVLLMAQKPTEYSFGLLTALVQKTTVKPTGSPDHKPLIFIYLYFPSHF